MPGSAVPRELQLESRLLHFQSGFRLKRRGRQVLTAAPPGARHPQTQATSWVSLKDLVLREAGPGTGLALWVLRIRAPGPVSLGDPKQRRSGEGDRAVLDFWLTGMMKILETVTVTQH